MILNKQQRDIVEIALRILGCTVRDIKDKHFELRGMMLVAIRMRVSSMELVEITNTALHLVLDEEFPDWRDDG